MVDRCRSDRPPRRSRRSSRTSMPPTRTSSDPIRASSSQVRDWRSRNDRPAHPHPTAGFGTASATVHTGAHGTVSSPCSRQVRAQDIADDRARIAATATSLAVACLEVLSGVRRSETIARWVEPELLAKIDHRCQLRAEVAPQRATVPGAVPCDRGRRTSARSARDRRGHGHRCRRKPRPGGGSPLGTAHHPVDADCAADDVSR